MNERDKILERVRKLRALAGSTNVHEAEAARKKMAAVMEEHGLVEADIMTPDDAGVREWPIEGVNFAPDWRLALLTAICMRCGCKALRAFEGREKVTGAVIGPKDMADSIVQLFRYFDREVSERSKKSWESYKAEAFDKAIARSRVENKEDPKLKAEFDEWVAPARPAFLASFRRGATIVLQDRILHGDIDVMAVWQARAAAEDSRETPAADAPEPASAASEPAVSFRNSVLMKQDPRAVSKRLVAAHMRGRYVERARFGRTLPPHHHAFKLGKAAGAEIPLPQSNQTTTAGGTSAPETPSPAESR